MQRCKAIIVFSPHPDDEVLGFAGIIHDAVRAGKIVKVVLLTHGEGFGSACYFWKNGCPAGDSTCKGSGCTKTDLDAFGKVRVEESKRALKQLGLDPENLIVLGYPDGFIGDMLRHPDSVYTSVTGNKISASGKSFTGKNLTRDLTSILRNYPGGLLFTTHIMDQHDDHAALAAFLQEARYELAQDGLQFQMYWSIIHQPGLGGNNNWPFPSCTWEFSKGDLLKDREKRYTPSQTLTSPEGFPDKPEAYFPDECIWNGKNGEKAVMRKAIDEYNTQSGMITMAGTIPSKEYQGWMDRNGFLLSFVKRNHLFWEAPVPVISSFK